MRGRIAYNTEDEAIPIEIKEVKERIEENYLPRFKSEKYEVGD